MAKYTSKLNLYKVDPAKDGNDTFNIKTMLNDNWDKVDDKVGSMSDKLDNVEDDANNYTHPAKHSADMITVSDASGNFSGGNVEDVLGEVGASLSAIAYQQATVNSREIQLTVPSFSFIENKYILVEITADISEGSALTVKVNSDTAIALKDSDDNALTSLDKGFYTFIARTGTQNFFLQAPKGGGVQPIQKAHQQGIETVVGEVKAGQYVYSNVDIWLDDGNYILDKSIISSDSTWLVTNDNVLVYFNSDDNSIYKVNVDGSNNSKLTSDKNRHKIGIDNEAIYYSTSTDNDYLYKINLDGTNKTRLNTDKSYYIAVADVIFYRNGSDGNALYKINKDGTGRLKLTSYSVDDIVASGTTAYYKNNADGNKIYKINSDGTGETKLTDKSSSNITISNGKIFFSSVHDNNSLYSINIDGTSEQKLNDVSSNYLAVTSKYVYYNSGNKLYRMTHSGFNIQKLSDNVPYYITVLSDDSKIFYVNGNTSKRPIYTITAKIIIPSVENGVRPSVITENINSTQHSTLSSTCLKAQTFTLDENALMKYIEFECGAGTPQPLGQAVSKLYSVGDGFSLTEIATSINSIDGSTLEDPKLKPKILFTYNEILLNAGVEYAISIEPTDTGQWRLWSSKKSYNGHSIYNLGSGWVESTSNSLYFRLFDATSLDDQFKTRNQGILKVASDHENAQVVGCISKKSLGGRSMFEFGEKVFSVNGVTISASSKRTFEGPGGNPYNVDANYITIDMSNIPFIPNKIMIYDVVYAGYPTIWSKDYIYVHPEYDTIRANCIYITANARVPYINGVMYFPVQRENYEYTYYIFGGE